MSDGMISTYNFLTDQKTDYGQSSSNKFNLFFIDDNTIIWQADWQKLIVKDINTLHEREINLESVHSFALQYRF
jgi:hypothetical protein